MFTDASCYPGKRKSFIGWATTDQLKTYLHLPGYFYAMVTRDPVVIRDWYDNGTKGHKVRLWARGVCLRADGGDIVFQTVMGTQCNELDNGRIIRIP